jgi:ATP-dependent DNA helicase RecG
MLEMRQGEKVMSEKILSLMMVNAEVTTIEMSQTLDVSTKTIERALDILKKENKIERVGGRKEGYWKVTLNIIH